MKAKIRGKTSTTQPLTQLPIRLPQRALALVLVVCCTLMVSCVAEETAQPDTSQADTVEVLRAVDGDTIIVEIGGVEERVRYIGIDAPESVQPNQPVECYGREAAEANATLVDGEPVVLQRDVTDRDRFGRLLRYVYVDGDADDGTLVNIELVRNGFAESVSYEPDVTRQDALDQAEQEARGEERGMWGAC